MMKNCTLKLIQYFNSINFHFHLQRKGGIEAFLNYPKQGTLAQDVPMADTVCFMNIPYIICQSKENKIG